MMESATGTGSQMQPEPERQPETTPEETQELPAAESTGTETAAATQPAPEPQVEAPDASPEPQPVLVGIDLGTTNSCIAYIDENGKAVVVPNADNERTTPSVVSFEDGEITIGKIAKRAALASPDQVVQYVKRSMGEEGYVKTFGEQDYTPETISALILKRLVQDAVEQLGRSIERAVVTVPAYFNEVERKATEDAGTIAGLEVLSVLNEPTAAALAYGLDRTGEKHRALVYDLGGGTFDVTVIEIEGNRIEVLATDGERRLGGIDWDDELINHLAEQFQSEHGIDPRDDLDAYQELRERAEDAKATLSRKPSAKVVLTCQGKTSKIEVTREVFDSITKSLLDQTETYLGVVLEKARLTWDGIDKVILVGGSTRMPAVREMVRRVTGTEPETGINPDEGIAMGAAYYGAKLLLDREKASGGEEVSEELEEVRQEAKILLGAIEVTNVSSHSLGILGRRPGDGTEINHIMVPAQTKLPAEHTEVCGTAEDGQTSVKIVVVEGETEDPEDCVVIGTCAITGLPTGRPAGTPIDITYRYGADGRLEVHARDRESGQDVTVTLDRESGLSEAQVAEATERLGALAVG